MRKKKITRCMILFLALMTGMFLMGAGQAFAGVGGSDVPTVPSPLDVGQTGIPFSFTITNQSTTPNNVHDVEVTSVNAIFFTTTCGSSLTPGIPCLAGDQEAANTIVINPLTATGSAGTACAGITFSVAATANPNEYVFTPVSSVILGPSSTGGAAATCTVDFTVDVLAAPVNDSSADAGLQTSQLARADLRDVTTNEHGSAAGSSTVTVQSHCLHVEKICTDAPTCDGDIGVSVTATNCGLEGLTGLTVTDDQSGALTCGSTDLAPGASTTCTGSYTGTQGQDSTDTITASATSADSQQIVTPDETSILSATCSTPPAPTISISKTCLDATSCIAGGIDFTITVTNGAVAGIATLTDASCDTPISEAIPLAADEVVTRTCHITGTAGSTVTNTLASVTIEANGCSATDTAGPVSCSIPSCPCQIQITKTVAPDDGSSGGTACDGVPDAPFVESVTVQQTDCVVYNICVTNSCTDPDCQTIDASGVTVSDDHLGIVSENFGILAPGDVTCKLVASEITVPVTACPNGVCVCQDVEGTNTAVVSSAVCEVSQTNACDETGSICEDTANVACVTEVGCRMTGGHNNSVSSVDAEYDGNGKSYTTGGQIGAPTNVGCCNEPPTSRGHNSDCPWGEWEHNHHGGSDDTGSVANGSFAFHSGTASAPDSAFIQDIICADEGWCVQARPAPVKQIFWEGTGVFHNTKGKKNMDVPLPYFAACGTDNQPVPWSNKVDGTLHYYRAHVGDFGEPAGINQKPLDGTCGWSDTCDLGSDGVGPGGVSISGCELVDGYCPFAPAPVNDKFTALHPLCTAQDCGCDTANDPSCKTNKNGCPDWYEIEIHCTADPTSPVAYKVAHFITEGNFQLHPAVGSSCQPCGDGICQAEYDENCLSCPQDCGECPL